MATQGIGQAVQTARARLALSIEELAERASLDVALLTSFEGGTKQLSTAKLDRVASALGIDAFALYEGNIVERTLVALPRHISRSDFKHADLPVLRRALEWGGALHDVSRLLGRPCLTERFAPQAPGAEPPQDGYHAARRVRHALGSTTAPLNSIHRLFAEQFQVPVLVESLATTSLQAVALRSSASRAAAVVLNSSADGAPVHGSYQGWLVDRVSMCHELCHILFDEARGGVLQLVLDDATTRGGTKPPIEQRAGAFAAEMLIPLFGLRQLFGDEGREVDTTTRADQMVDKVRSHFKTPAEIAVNHLYNHGYVCRMQTFREELLERAQERELARGGSAPAEPIDPWLAELTDRVREALDASLITEGTARALLNIEAGAPIVWASEGP